MESIYKIYCVRTFFHFEFFQKKEPFIKKSMEQLNNKRM